MKPGLKIGENHLTYQEVHAGLTVPRVLPGSLLEYGEEVLASGILVAILENACWSAIADLIEPHESRVGCRSHLNHIAPARPGDLLKITATCTQLRPETIDLYWNTHALNLTTQETIATMPHTLRVIPREDFQRRLDRRRLARDDQRSNCTRRHRDRRALGR